MGFVPFAGGLTAALLAPRSPYLAAAVVWVGAAVVGTVLA